MPHKDPVTPQLRDLVIERDTKMRWSRLMTIYQVDMDSDLAAAMDLLREAKKNPCVAQIVDPLGSGPCSGPMTLDHVHLHSGGTKGKRAPSDPQHLVTLCEWHHLGSKGGHIWATANRPLLRGYLLGLYYVLTDIPHGDN